MGKTLLDLCLDEAVQTVVDALFDPVEMHVKFAMGGIVQAGRPYIMGERPSPSHPALNAACADILKRHTASEHTLSSVDGCPHASVHPCPLCKMGPCRERQ